MNNLNNDVSIVLKKTSKKKLSKNNKNLIGLDNNNNNNNNNNNENKSEDKKDEKNKSEDKKDEKNKSEDKSEDKKEDNNDIIQSLCIQKKGLKRNTIDKYYTKSCIVEQCIELVKKYINISNNDLIIEPSAGNGSFIEYIKTLSNNYIFYDLEPEHNEVLKQDFLELDYRILKKRTQNINIHIIGNPPFGRQSSLAIKFIKKCCLFSNSISFILPKSFKKDSMKKCFDKYFHLTYEIDILENSFLVNGNECNVPCVFQIWQYKKDDIRNIVPIEKPLNFKFVEKNSINITDNNVDISFRRVGVNAGTIMKEIDSKSVQSHYFIKFTNNKTIDENIEQLKLLKFNFNNTVGPKSISKPELINEFNKLLI